MATMKGGTKMAGLGGITGGIVGTLIGVVIGWWVSEHFISGIASQVVGGISGAVNQIPHGGYSDDY